MLNSRAAAFVLISIVVSTSARATAAPVAGRLVVELSEEAATRLARGGLRLPVPPGGEALEPRVQPLFPGRDGRLARFALVRFRADRAGANSVSMQRAWIEALRGSADVRRVDEDHVFPAAALPDDPFFPEQAGPPRQFHLRNPGGLSLGADRAWPFVPEGAEVVVAILDTGVDWEHPDLGGPTPPASGVLAVDGGELTGAAGIDDDGNGYVDDVVGWDFVDLTGVSLPSNAVPAPGEDGLLEDADPSDRAGHGTEVAGLVNAITDNGIGIAGGSPPARLLPVRVGWRGTDGTPWVLMSFCAQGLVYAAENGARVANCSWDSGDLSGLGAAIDVAVVDAGMVVVGSAGNGNTQSTSIEYLASRPDCIGVAGVESTGVKSAQSNYGTWVDLAAFFGGMATTSYDYVSATSVIRAPFGGGTSFAAPQVTALAALLVAVDGGASAATIRAALTSTARDLSDLDPVHGPLLGGGLADYRRAVEALGGGWDAIRPAGKLLPLGGMLSYLGPGGIEVVDADSGAGLAGWPPTPVSYPDPGTGAAALAGISGLFDPVLLWTDGDSLHARGVGSGIPAGWPLPLPPGAGSPIAVGDDAALLSRVLVPTMAGLFRIDHPVAGPDTVTLSLLLHGVAAASAGEALWIAGLDPAGNLHFRREGGSASAETTLVLPAGALPPVLGEFEAQGPLLAVTAVPDAGDAPGLQHVLFVDVELGAIQDVTIPGPPFVTLSLAGFPGLGRMEAVAADSLGRLVLVGADGSVRAVEAGGALAGEPLCADLDGDYDAELIALRRDGTLLAWSEVLGAMPGFPRRFPAGFEDAPVIVDGTARRHVAAADTAGSLWAVPAGVPGTPAAWVGPRGSAGRSGFLAHEPAVPVRELAVSLTGRRLPSGGIEVCWTGEGFEILARLRLRDEDGGPSRWEGPASPLGCASVSGSGGGALALEGWHLRQGWLQLGVVRIEAEPAPRVGLPEPNPFRSRTRVTWSSRTGTARLEVFDLGGRRVWRGTAPAAAGGAGWDGRDASGRAAPAGIYFLRVGLEGRMETRRVLKLP